MFVLSAARLVVAGCQCTQVLPDLADRRRLSQVTADFAVRSPRWNPDAMWRPSVPRARSAQAPVAATSLLLCVEGVTALEPGVPRPVAACGHDPRELSALEWAETVADTVLAVPHGPADVYLLFAGRVLAPVCRDLHTLAGERADVLRCATPLAGTAASPFLIDHVLRLTDARHDAPGWTPLPLVGEHENAATRV